MHTICGDSARPTMEPVYMPLYTNASDRERSPVGTHLGTNERTVVINRKPNTNMFCYRKLCGSH
jgi:hypothetical protein